MARKGTSLAAGLPTFDVQPFYSAISMLKDGSILSPVEFFTPVAQQTY